MTTIDMTLKKMAVGMINRQGADAIYIQYTNSGYSPTTGTVERKENRIPVKLCLFEFLRAGNGEKAINNTLTEIADKQAYISSETYLNANAGVDLVEITRADGSTQQYIVKVMKEHGCDPRDVIMYDAWLETC